MEVHEIMTPDPGVCTIADCVRDAALMMRDCDCGAIPVVEDRESLRLVGLITDRDIAIRIVSAGLDPASTAIGDCMSTGISFVNPSSTIDEVEQIMENLQVRRVPVVDDSGKMCGIVSLADIARTRPDQKSNAIFQKVSEPTQEAEHAAFLS